MAFCSKCGSQMADGTAFCPKCGQAMGKAVPGGGAPGAAAQSGLSENAAGALSYVLGWVTGIIFFLIDKRPYVRFHAAQSIVVFGGLHLILIVWGMVFGMGFFFGGFGGLGAGFGLAILVHMILNLLCLVLWILLMIKGGSGERFRVPFAADLADNLAGKQI